MIADVPRSITLLNTLGKVICGLLKDMVLRSATGGEHSDSSRVRKPRVHRQGNYPGGRKRVVQKMYCVFLGEQKGYDTVSTNEAYILRKVNFPPDQGTARCGLPHKLLRAPHDPSEDLKVLCGNLCLRNNQEN